MKKSTWIGGFLGWIIYGPLGGIIGALIGSAIGEDESGSSSSFFSGEDGHTAEGNRNSFLMSMLLLASYIIKADGGKVSLGLGFGSFFFLYFRFVKKIFDPVGARQRILEFG